MKYFLLILLFLSLSACSVENVQNNNDAPTPTPDATVTDNPTIFEFPSGTVILKELLPNEVDKIEIEHTDMSGSYVISIESEEKIQTIINLLSDVEISDEYEPIFGVNSEGFEIRLFDEEENIFTFDEGTEYFTLDVSYNHGKKKSYAYTNLNEEERTNGIFSMIIDACIPDYHFYINNGRSGDESYDVEFIPLLIEGDGYTITGETALYAWPPYNIENIDFTAYTFTINDEVITSYPEETGEYILIVDNGNGLYQLKIFVE